MLATCILHIGMHKTATTTIQSAFFRNRALFREHGINYFSMAANHSIPLYSLYCEKPEEYHINIRDGIDTKEKAAAHNGVLEKAFRAELEGNKSPIVVLCGEDLSLLPPGGVQKLKESLVDYFDEMQVVVYVRAPYAFISSYSQELIKQGRTMAQVIAAPPLPEYRFRIEKYVERFGEENVIVREFAREKLLGGNIVEDFLSVFVDDADRRRIVGGLGKENANQSLSAGAIELLSKVNELEPLFLEGKLNPKWAKTLPPYLRALKGRKFQLGSAELSHCRPSIEADVNWLKEHTKGSVDFALDEGKTESVLSEDIPAGDMALLVNSVVVELENERARRLLLEAIFATPDIAREEKRKRIRRAIGMASSAESLKQMGHVLEEHSYPEEAEQAFSKARLQ